MIADGREEKFWGWMWYHECRPTYQPLKRAQPVGSVGSAMRFECCVCGENRSRGLKYRRSEEYKAWRREHNVGCARRDAIAKLGVTYSETDLELERSLWLLEDEASARVLADLLLERGVVNHPDDVLNLFHRHMWRAPCLWCKPPGSGLDSREVNGRCASCGGSGVEDDDDEDPHVEGP